MTIADWFGAIGVFLILLGYILNVVNVLSSKHVVFTLLNMIGAALAGIGSYLIDYIPFIILESAWVLVSVFALIKNFKEKEKVVEV